MTESDFEDLHIVLIHDRLTVPGGGERVAQFIAEAFNCTIYTSEYRPKDTFDFSHTNAEINELDSKSFGFREFFKSRQHINWKSYDLAILSGNRSQLAAWKKIPIPTIRYTHLVARPYWSLRDQEFRSAKPSEKLIRCVKAPLIRQLDRHLAGNTDKIIANSHNVRSQIERFYGYESTVVHPPIDTSKYKYNSPDDYWLSVNRISPAKRIREQILAFVDTEETLVIAGAIDPVFETYGKEIENLVEENENVKLIGFVSDAELRDLYANSKGIIHIPQYEDFGIVPVEAMASGKPVIGAAEGGLLETVEDGETGWLIDPTIENIRTCLSRFDEGMFSNACQDQAKQFDKSIFKEEISREVIDLIE